MDESFAEQPYDTKKLSIRTIIEKILYKHKIAPDIFEYYLKLRMPSYDDLVIEKVGEQMLAGHCYIQNGI